MIFLDTSYLVALVMRSDALHAAAVEWSGRVSGPCVTTEYVLVELVNRLSAPLHRSRAHALLASVSSNAQIQVIPASEQWFRAGVALHAERNDKAWSLTDCISFEVMRATGVTQALTYDQHFEQAGFSALLRRPAATS
ncbi:MAG: PIN domain-containing protein [Phycisphaerae bacterium]